MKTLNILIATFALALATPIAGAATAQLDLLPDGARASFVPPQIESGDGASDVGDAKRFFNKDTGGVPPR